MLPPALRKLSERLRRGAGSATRLGAARARAEAEAMANFGSWSPRLRHTGDEIRAAVDAALLPGETIVAEVWTKPGDRLSRYLGGSDLPDIHVGASVVADAKAVKDLRSVWKGTTGLLQDLLPVRIVVTQGRVLIGTRPVTATGASVAAYPRAEVHVARFRRGLPIGRYNVLVLEFPGTTKPHRVKYVDAFEGRLRDVAEALRDSGREVAP